ncbi:hypothetical protein C8035_v001239 [Colletotrichum spinosum]|uniref:Uncharacterized protein n=1 Tax=Colletotrichum spinosum TaxID=1347390 RepID=A0A4R8QIV0_9PEZI|nr:hypothetical protein C8035_v001239 [Colletotrichum spinosum]
MTASLARSPTTLRDAARPWTPTAALSSCAELGQVRCDHVLRTPYTARNRSATTPVIRRARASRVSERRIWHRSCQERSSGTACEGNDLTTGVFGLMFVLSSTSIWLWRETGWLGGGRWSCWYHT